MGIDNQGTDVIAHLTLPSPITTRPRTGEPPRAVSGAGDNGRLLADAAGQGDRGGRHHRGPTGARVFDGMVGWCSDVRLDLVRCRDVVTNCFLPSPSTPCAKQTANEAGLHVHVQEGRHGHHLHDHDGASAFF